MISAREIVYGVYGAYRLCRFDAQGLAYFNASREGFWRSFFAAVLVAPAAFLITALHVDKAAIHAGPLRIALIEGLAYVILVFAYPVTVFPLCRLLDREANYITYVIAYNWAGVIQMLLVLPFALLAASGVLPSTVANLAWLAVNGVTLAMLWYIAKAALRVPAGMAVALVTIDLVIGLVVDWIAEARLAIA